MKPAAKTAEMPRNKKIVIERATVSEMLETLHVRPSEVRRAKLALAAVARMDQKRRSARVAAKRSKASASK
ncbi:MAG TPA: hypothetical protein VFO89_11280 [Thermoanaerobaculia bacterium]|nr:hypothetical protein [Thermoanaerobaculia bacterium]